MAEQYGFFPDVNGDREQTSDFLAKWIASIIGTGVYNGELAVTAGSNMQITVPTGRAWINGYHYRNDGNLTLTIANADGTLNRKDIIVLRWDVNARSITAQAIKGTPASNAMAPAIVRTAEQYDLKLAEISIPAGTTAITNALITDTRLDKSVCGIVTGVVDQVNTTALYNQIQFDLANFKGVNEADFTAWVNSLKSVLDESTAGNLLNMIQTHEADTVAHMTQAQKDTLSAAVQSATLGGAAVPKSGTTLQFPAYPTSLPANGGNANYATTAGSAPATGGWANTANYPTHAVGLADFGLRGNYISNVAPSGGSDGDTWDQY
jgi:hypothetical protein